MPFTEYTEGGQEKRIQKYRFVTKGSLLKTPGAVYPFGNQSRRKIEGGGFAGWCYGSRARGGA